MLKGNNDEGRLIGRHGGRNNEAERVWTRLARQIPRT